MPDVTVNGVRLRYEERGTGAPILGLHAVAWEDAAERLAELGRVIIYDRRGSSRSERPEPYEVTSVRKHATTRAACWRRSRPCPAVVIGRSYGGMVELDLALRHPETVRGLALLEAAVLGLSPEYDAWFERLRPTLEDAVRERSEEAAGKVALGEVFDAWEELPAAMRDVFTANGPAPCSSPR
jgi:pimeloyl-ACP methyl ester carboxylesterase